MEKKYSIYLDSIKIGTTLFEIADPPMGVVFGVISFAIQNGGYDFFKDYCDLHKIELAVDYPKDKLISTSTIENLKVINESGIEIKGVGNQISGIDGESFEVALEGIPYPFYEEEFPHHRKSYDEKFK